MRANFCQVNNPEVFGHVVDSAGEKPFSYSTGVSRRPRRKRRKEDTGMESGLSGCNVMDTLFNSVSGCNVDAERASFWCCG
jgi:hypothetical protein